MWLGLRKRLMWKDFNPDGTLVYGNFLETVQQIIPMYWMRAIGGTLFIVGMLIMVYNVIVTIRKGSAVEDELAEAAALTRVTGRRTAGETFHTWLERRPVQLTILATVAILVGGIVQIIPTLVG